MICFMIMNNNNNWITSTINLPDYLVIFEEWDCREYEQTVVFTIFFIDDGLDLISIVLSCLPFIYFVTFCVFRKAVVSNNHR